MLVRGSNVREHQTGLRQGPDYTDQIFILRQLLENRYTYRRSAILVFLGSRGAFHSASRTALQSAIHRKSSLYKSMNLLRVLCAHKYGQVSVCDDLSNTFKTDSGD